jgi:hypothetical protein
MLDLLTQFVIMLVELKKVLRVWIALNANNPKQVFKIYGFNT